MAKDDWEVSFEQQVRELKELGITPLAFDTDLAKMAAQWKLECFEWEQMAVEMIEEKARRTTSQHEELRTGDEVPLTPEES